MRGTHRASPARRAAAHPHDAQRLGIVTIYQEFTLAPNMTIAENVFIGREPGPRPFVNWRSMAAETRAITAAHRARPRTRWRWSATSRVAEQQMVEIARALSMRSRLIVMDEPTSALSSSEVDKLFRIIRDLKAQGLSHHLRHPPAGGGDGDLRPLHGAARRPARRQRRRSPIPMSTASSA